MNQDRRFSAGHLTNPQPGDERLETFEGAVNAAMEGSKDNNIWSMAHPLYAAWRRVNDVASWEDDSDEILAVIYQQQIFTP